MVVPLHEGLKLKLDGLVSWPPGARIGLKGTPVELRDPKGRLHFDPHGVSADGIEAQLWGGPLRLDISTQGQTPEDHLTLIQARATTPVATLAERLPNPLWSQLQGTPTWDLAVRLRAADVEREAPPSRLRAGVRPQARRRAPPGAPGQDRRGRPPPAPGRTARPRRGPAARPGLRRPQGAPGLRRQARRRPGPDRRGHPPSAPSAPPIRDPRPGRPGRAVRARAPATGSGSAGPSLSWTATPGGSGGTGRHRPSVAPRPTAAGRDRPRDEPGLLRGGDLRIGSLSLAGSPWDDLHLQLQRGDQRLGGRDQGTPDHRDPQGPGQAPGGAG